MTHLDPGVEPHPQRLVLGVRPGHEASGRPPVRIFIGSEPAQRRAERVLLWSIERARDPSRSYEIWLLRSLSGFRRQGWTTGFTNYRFAIPHLAGGSGRAIYNDVDQIYLDDPGRLFDAALDPHGFLSVAPDDTSVMLLDCGRMAAVWTLDAAREHSKEDLVRLALAEPGLRGPLDPGWNARDDEFEPGRSQLLHYTTLHTQPWRPFPGRFAYQASRHAALWLELEAEADRAGWRAFGREHPSDAWRALGVEPELERTPTDDLPWRLDELFRSARGGVLRLEIRCERAPTPGDDPARTSAWWSAEIERVAAAHRGVRWEASLGEPGGRRRERCGGPRPDGSPPRVWVLTDDRGGNTTQSIGLAEALGWPYERRAIVPGPLSMLHNRLLGASRAGASRKRSSPLAPPWPDLVIAAGRRTAPVALWIREQSLGRTRLVQLGRKGGDAAERFDLVVTPTYTRLFPHPHRVETCAPLHSVTPRRLEQAAARWRERISPLPAPRIALLVGGRSGQYAIDATSAGRLGAEVARLAREAGGSVLATTSRRTGEPATRAIRAALGPDAFLHTPDDGGDNPYLALLALCDWIVATGDSESMLAEAAATGKPLLVYPLPVRTSFRLLRWPRDLVLSLATARPPGPRGTPRPQRGLARLCGRAIERGWVRPARDLDRLHAELLRRGLAEPFHGAPPERRGPGAPLDDLEQVAARVRTLLGLAEPEGAPGVNSAEPSDRGLR